MTTPTGRHSGYPQPPAHPGRKQDDGARQVSWLAGSSLSLAFPRHHLSGTSNDCSPVTVAGAAAGLNRVPFQIPLRGTLRVLKRGEYTELTLHRASGYDPAGRNDTDQGSHDKHHFVRITRLAEA
jgi:hypothetical protein